MHISFHLLVPPSESQWTFQARSVHCRRTSRRVGALIGPTTRSLRWPDRVNMGVRKAETPMAGHAKKWTPNANHGHGIGLSVRTLGRLGERNENTAFTTCDFQQTDNVLPSQKRSIRGRATTHWILSNSTKREKPCDDPGGNWVHGAKWYSNQSIPDQLLRQAK
jgi:hypothetical protein